MRATTSLRLSDDLRERLAAAAQEQETTVTSLVERYAREGLAIDAHPGVVFKGGASGRRAALAGGPDVWEVIAALRTASGSEDDRVHAVAQQLDVHPRQVTLALGYAADRPDEIEARIDANEAALERVERAHRARQRLLDSA